MYMNGGGTESEVLPARTPPGKDDTPSEEYFSQAALEECVVFLRSKYVEYKQDVTEAAFGVRRRPEGRPNGTGHSLPVTRFHKALVYNARFVEDVLDRLSVNETHHVLTALLNYDEVHMGKAGQSDDGKQAPCGCGDNVRVDITGLATPADWKLQRGYERFMKRIPLTLALAACSGSQDILKLLLGKGAEVMQADEDGNTTIHHLINLSENHPKKAVDMYTSTLALRRKESTHTNSQ